MSLNKDMGDAHECFLIGLLGGRQARGSGNQWRQPMDGRTSRKHLRYAFAWDGKSTLSKSVGVTREMWRKAVEQAGGHLPMLALRFYTNESLDSDLDLAVVNIHDFAEVIEMANKMATIDDVGCLDGDHDHAKIESDSVPGMMIARGECRGCGKWPSDVPRSV